jgi:hypothetical protein
MITVHGILDPWCQQHNYYDHLICCFLLWCLFNNSHGPKTLWLLVTPPSNTIGAPKPEDLQSTGERLLSRCTRATSMMFQIPWTNKIKYPPKALAASSQPVKPAAIVLLALSLRPPLLVGHKSTINEWKCIIVASYNNKL